MFKNQDGITLVALVITIIVLLILAGVSIAMLTNSGILSKSQEAVNQSRNATEAENYALDTYANYLNEAWNTYVD